MSCLVIDTLIVSRRLECVLFSNSYFFVCYFIHHCKSSLLSVGSNHIDEAETIAYPSRAPEFFSVFSGFRVVQSLVFCATFCISLFVPMSFFRLAIVVRLHVYDYPSGIFAIE